MRAPAVATAVILLSLAGCGGGDGGVELRFHAGAGAQPDAAILRDRLARLGIAAATVKATPSGLIVRAPGIDAAGARPLAQQLAGVSPLRFYDWEANVVGPGCRIIPADTAISGGAHAGSVAFGLLPDVARARVTRCPGTIAIRARGAGADRWYVLRDRPGLTGAAIRHPRAFRDEGATGTGESKVTFDFTREGVRRWRALTRAVARRDRRAAAAGGDPQHVAVVLDDTLLSTPSIAYRDFPDGIDATFGSQIDGGLSERTAHTIAAAVTRGTLSVPLELDRVRPMG